ncbi:MAG: hypothetical protein O7G84_00850 [Gammaproteobacteria bacterium]|nr:hypothetical protein [Gammaproteobacteria bacterium]
MTQDLSNEDFARRMREQRGEPRLIRLPAVMRQGERLAEFAEQWERVMMSAGLWRKPTLASIEKTVEAMPGVLSAEATETSPGVVEVSAMVRGPVIYSKTIRIPLSSVPLP